MTNSYATDGKCHNSEPGTYGHECGKPAQWIGTDYKGFRCGFCDQCKRHGTEAKAISQLVKTQGNTHHAQSAVLQ